MTLKETFPNLAKIADDLSLCLPSRQFMKDFGKAEAEAKQAIAAEPADFFALFPYEEIKAKYPELTKALDEIAQ